MITGKDIGVGGGHFATAILCPNSVYFLFFKEKYTNNLDLVDFDVKKELNLAFIIKKIAPLST